MRYSRCCAAALDLESAELGRVLWRHCHRLVRTGGSVSKPSLGPGFPAWCARTMKSKTALFDAQPCNPGEFAIVNSIATANPWGTICEQRDRFDFGCLCSTGFAGRQLDGPLSLSNCEGVDPGIVHLIGGSFVAFLSKVQPKDRTVAASAILSFSIACLIGTYIGIAVNAHELLGPRSADLNNYLRDTVMGQADSIDQRKRNGQLNADQAYEELRKVLEKK
jgi:hypothetical protein